VNSNFINKIPSGSPKQINVVIEIPKGSNIKYEIDKESGLLSVDRKLFTAMFYPCNYGFIPSTLEGDGDPVDVLVISEFVVAPLTILRAIPVGVLLTEDEEGQDSKIIAIPISKIDSSFSYIKDIDDLPEMLKKQIEHFFTHYKELEEGKYVKITGWGNREMAEERIIEAINRYPKIDS